MSNEMILYRDLRTTSCQSTYNDNDDISENCDKIEQIRRKSTSFRAHKNQSSKFPTKLFKYILIVSSIITLVSQCEARPTTRNNMASIEQNHKLKFCEHELEGHGRVGNSSDLKELLAHCRSAVRLTEGSIDQYLSIVFQSNKSDHYGKWDNRSQIKDVLPWLFPRVELKKAYNGELDRKHKEVLESTHWTDRKIFEHLEDIFVRLTRIQLGFDVINKWIFNKKDSDNSDDYKEMEKVFGEATQGIHEAIVQIKDYFESKFKNHPCEPQDVIAPPITFPEFRDVKLNHWYVYREYEHVMRYASELVNIITRYQEHHKE